MCSEKENSFERDDAGLPTSLSLSLSVSVSVSLSLSSYAQQFEKLKIMLLHTPEKKISLQRADERGASASERSLRRSNPLRLPLSSSVALFSGGNDDTYALRNSFF